MAYPLSFYTHIQLFPLYVSLLLLVLLFIVSVACYCKPCCGENPAKRFLVFLAKITFTPPSGLLGYSEEKDEVYIKKTLVLYKYPLVILGGYVLLFVMITMTVCWEIGIIDETYGNCDTTRMDCFVSTPDEKDVPVVNCSNHTGDDKATIVCFHPIGNIAAVPAVFGSMLSFIQLAMRLLSKACLWYYSIKGLKYYSRERKECLTGIKTSTTCLKLFYVVGLSLTTIITVIIIPVLLKKCFEHVLPRSGEFRFGGIMVLTMMALWLTAFIPWHRFGYEPIQADGGRTSGKEPTPSDSGGLLLSINTAEEEPFDIPIEPIGGSYRPSGTGEGTVPTSEAKTVADSGGGSDGDKEQESRELTWWEWFWGTEEDETQGAEDTTTPTDTSVSSSGGTPTTKEGLRRRPLPPEKDS